MSSLVIGIRGERGTLGTVLALALVLALAVRCPSALAQAGSPSKLPLGPEELGAKRSLWLTDWARHRLFTPSSDPMLLSDRCQSAKGGLGQICRLDFIEVPVPRGLWRLVALSVVSGKQDQKTEVWNRHEIYAVFGMIEQDPGTREERITRLLSVQTEVDSPQMTFGNAGFGANPDCTKKQPDAGSVYLHSVLGSSTANDTDCVLVHKTSLPWLNPYQDDIIGEIKTDRAAMGFKPSGVEAYFSVSANRHYLDYKVFFSDADRPEWASEALWQAGIAGWAGWFRQCVVRGLAGTLSLRGPNDVGC